MHNNYNFGDLDISQGSDEEDEDDVIKSENEEESGEEDTNEKKAKPQTKKQAPEDLDNLLKEFGGKFLFLQISGSSSTNDRYCTKRTKTKET